MDWTKRLMGKSDCRELLTLAVELALMAETRYRPLPSLYVELATKIHDVIGDDETSIVSCSCNCLPFILYKYINGFACNELTFKVEFIKQHYCISKGNFKFLLNMSIFFYVLPTLTSVSLYLRMHSFTEIVILLILKGFFLNVCLLL